MAARKGPPTGMFAALAAPRVYRSVYFTLVIPWKRNGVDAYIVTAFPRRLDMRATAKSTSSLGGVPGRNRVSTALVVLGHRVSLVGSTERNAHLFCPSRAPTCLHEEHCRDHQRPRCLPLRPLPHRQRLGLTPAVGNGK